VTRQRTDEKAKYRKTPDGKLLYLPSTRTHQYLRGRVLQRPDPTTNPPVIRNL
jgi:hypothetical protein